jgi:very-short-patch-repair endonuclease
MAGGVTVSRETMIKDLRTIIEHHDKVALFDETPLLSQLFGAEARGIDSPFDNAVAAAAWYVELREITARLGNPGGDLLRQAWTASVAQWREAVDCVMASPDAWNAAGSIDEALRSAGDGACATRSVGAIREQLIERAGIADAILGVGQQAGAGGGVTIEWLKHQLASVRAACIADERLRAEAHVIAALGVPVLGTETNVEPIQAALEYIAQVLAEALPAPIATWLLGPDARDRLSRLQGAAHRLGVALDGYDRSETDVVHLGRLDGAQWCRIVQIDADQYSLASAPLSLLEARLDRALARAGALHPWSQCQRARATAVAGGLAVLVSLIEREGLDRAQAAEAYEAVFFRSLADALLRTDRTLDAFDGAAHDDVQKRFATLDRQVLQLTRHQIAAKLVRAPAVPGVAGRVAVSELSEEALIMHEAGKQRRHIAIRELFQRSGKAIQTMMPCFLMGPHAVAQYLPAGRFEFDLVVMDEASQMRVEDALGAIARGRQVVIVGDPMQLGPTKFFDSQDDDDGIDDCVDDNDNDDKEKEPAPAVSGPSLLERSESILAAAAVRFPTRMLRWHYRSRHPKLIAFSNREFYGGRLVVFPTPAITDEYHGVFLTCVSDAVYGDRQNRREAEAVVEAIRRHARTAPKDSLLVATLNKDQADLIDRLVEAAEKDDPELQAFRARHEGTRERLDVKNLESVQGDERDVILVSVTFGHDAAGKLRQNFGPILQSGGERRLNVLFTRAKRRLEVFCSFDPSTLRVGEGSSRGLKVLRDYLLYAQGEAYWAVGAETGRPPDSDFEVAVATALSRCGYEVRPQIGVAGYFIDLAIVDPDRPGRFILGVECDGATYHSAKSARDRDRLRQQQLEALGWRIHRIWSTDWFRDPEGQAKRVATRIEALRAARSADADADAAD